MQYAIPSQHDFQLPNSNFYHKYSPFCVALSIILFAHGISTPAKHGLLNLGFIAFLKSHVLWYLS